jgi:hypothetical protein
MDQGRQTFAIRWSRLTWVVTVGASVGFAVVSIALVWAAMHAVPGVVSLRTVMIVLALAPLGVVGVVILFAPMGFEVTGDAVVVKRLGRDVTISRGDIREVRRLDVRQTGFTWRLCGSGGFFGWFGLFHNRGLGDFWAYAGNQDDLVLLTLADGTKVVLSPSMPDAFLEAMQEAQG